MVLCLPVDVIVCVILSVVVCPGVVLYKGARAPGVGVAGWDGAVTILLTEVVGVSAGITVMPPAVAVPTVAVLGAGGSEVPHLVAGVAARPGLKVPWAIDTNVANMATHGTKVVHVDNWRGGRERWGIPQHRGAWGKGDGDGHRGGRADSVRGEGASLTLIGVVVILLADGARGRGGCLALSFVLLLFFLTMRWNRDRA